jgi:hypothetical protein
LARTIKAFAANLTLVVAASAVSLIALELMVRAWRGVPVFAMRDFRALASTDARAEYDPELGWRIKSNVAISGFNTLDYGIRKNGREHGIRTGGMLAVGDSFTVGYEVADEETWPALLEQLTATPVVNGGVAGYGIDQSIMRAEQLLPVVRPSVLLVGMLRQDIERANHSTYGHPKPYYVVDNNDLVLRNSPVPKRTTTGTIWLSVKHWLGHSLIAERLMAKLDPLGWYGYTYAHIQNDPVDVACKLLQRLKRRTDALSIRTLLVVQYGSLLIEQDEQPPSDAQRVGECARFMGIQVVDEFATLRALFKSDRATFARLYVSGPTPTGGHMSATGNLRIAHLIADALKQPPTIGSTDASPAPAPAPTPTPRSN